MLKLCLALPVFHPTFGGGSLRFQRYGPGFRARGVETRILAGTARRRDAAPEELALGWHHEPVGTQLPVTERGGMPIHRVCLPERTGVHRTATWFRALIDLCRDPATRPDVIQLHSFERVETLFWLWRLRRLGIPTVYAIQIAPPARIEPAPLRWARGQLTRAFHDAFDAVETSSEQIAHRLAAAGVRKPIVVIPNGVDLERHRPADVAERERARAELGLVGKGPVLMSVGAVCSRKGSQLLGEAWLQLLDRHPEVELVFVGPRHDRRDLSPQTPESDLDRLARRAPRPDRIHFSDTRSDVHALYAAADIVVLPTEREGGTPNAVLEAMACGVPVLLTPFEGQSAAIGRPGVEFEQVERSLTGLVGGLDGLLSSPDRRTELARNGLEWVRKHLDVERSLDRFVELYQQLAAGHPVEARP